MRSSGSVSPLYAARGDALTGEPARDAGGVGDREAVDDPGAGQGRDDGGQPREPLGLARHAQRVEDEARPREWAPQGERVPRRTATARRRRRGRSRWRWCPSTGTSLGSRSQHAPDAAVVGPEVVAPVADAVHLVDHEHPDARRERGEDVGAERRVGEALGRDEEHVDDVGLEVGGDLVPLVAVVAVDRAGGHAAAGAGVDLVAHEREQRRDDQRRTRARVAQEAGRDEVDGALAPAGALDDQHPPPILDQCADRVELTVAELGVRRRDERAEDLGGARPDVGVHRRTVPAGCDTARSTGSGTRGSGGGFGARQAEDRLEHRVVRARRARDRRHLGDEVERGVDLRLADHRAVGECASVVGPSDRLDVHRRLVASSGRRSTATATARGT